MTNVSAAFVQSLRLLRIFLPRFDVLPGPKVVGV